MRNMTKTVSGTSTVSTELLGNFNKDIANYVDLLSKSLNQETLFGKVIQAPSKNVMEIAADYIKLSTANLVKQGVKSTRAKSISKYTIETALASQMNSFGN